MPDHSALPGSQPPIQARRVRRDAGARIRVDVRTVGFLQQMRWARTRNDVGGETRSHASASVIGGVARKHGDHSRNSVSSITATLKADVDTNRIPGAVLIISRHGKVLCYDAVGGINPAADAPMSRDAIFRLFSMSKPITRLRR